MQQESGGFIGRPYDFTTSQRIASIIERIMALPENEVGLLLDEAEVKFSERHRDLKIHLRERFEQLKPMIPVLNKVSDQRGMLIGFYFLSEYSIESAALFNPSIVPHPDQSGVPAGSLRFVLSLRAVGEGHVSSITFREGMISPDHRISTVPGGRYVAEARRLNQAKQDGEIFLRKLAASGLRGPFVEDVAMRLREPLGFDELKHNIEADSRRAGSSEDRQGDQEIIRRIWMLADSNCEVTFHSGQSLSERVLFPMTALQKNGIEDARFVLFREDGGKASYYGTYTAYDGRRIEPQMLVTADFMRIRFMTLHGSAVRNKGMALFPRKVNGLYAMLGRQDNETITLMFSDSIHFWEKAEPILTPAFPWESVQLGNCGSPMETESGWLVLSHGVGPMRTYCIGAFLLDRENPRKVLGRLREPLLEANETEREGYVPNVVYSCGSLLHRGELIIPYGASDCYASFARVPVDEVIRAME
jgi:predicted GH43/DUF377 family glycosyl hydrolase